MMIVYDDDLQSTVILSPGKYSTLPKLGTTFSHYSTEQ